MTRIFTFLLPWFASAAGDAKRSELHRIPADRAESADVAKDHPEIVAQLTMLALDWKAALPPKPDPACISAADRAQISAPKTQPAKKATPDRAKAFERMDTNKDGVLTLDEYKIGFKNQPNLETRFKNVDKNRDGKLTREEFVNPGGK
ncbi:MAG: hypothetical protein HY301_15000 [Verrucomicrobia bacterium]|nr:hypothetical protein [Verrucomicrobiota bacterium]